MHPIDELGADLGGLDGFRGEFRGRGDEADPGREALPGKGVSLDEGAHSRPHAAQFALRQIGAGIDGIGQIERQRRPVGAGHVARLQDAVLDNAVGRGVKLRVGQLLAGEGERSLLVGQRRLGLGEVRREHVDVLAGDADGDVVARQSCLFLADVRPPLLRLLHRARAGALELGIPGVLLLGEGQRRLVRVDRRLGFRHHEVLLLDRLLQVVDARRGGVHIGRGLVGVRLQARGVQLGEQLAFLYPVAFLHQNAADAVAVVEGELRLADVDRAIDRDGGRGRRGPAEPLPCRDPACYQQREEGD